VVESSTELLELARGIEPPTCGLHGPLQETVEVEKEVEKRENGTPSEEK
jgi:hypothetical protein